MERGTFSAPTCQQRRVLQRYTWILVLVASWVPVRVSWNVLGNLPGKVLKGDVSGSFRTNKRENSTFQLAYF